jgi:anti-anti-sigma factor
MQIVETKSDGVVIVEPQGRMDSVTAKPFGDRVVELIRGGSHHLLIDLQQVRYISSAGFRSLLIARKLIDEFQGKLVLCGMSPEIKRLFEIGHFMDLFLVCGTRDEGLSKAQA